MRILFHSLFGLLMLLTASGKIALPPQGRTIYVTRCVGQEGNGLPTSPFQTVSRAVQEAPPGSTLIVESGIYDESVNMSQRLTVKAVGGPVQIRGHAATRKLCQLTGEQDLELCKRSTLNRTFTTAQVAGTDLGIPVEYKGRIYFLFGDTIPANGDERLDQTYNPFAARPFDGDSIAWTDANSDPEQCLLLNYIKVPSVGPLTQTGYLSPRLRKPTGEYVNLGTCEVPTGAFSVKDSSGREKLYAFFTTSHRGTTEENNIEMGSSELGLWTDETTNLFTHISQISCQSYVCGDTGIGKFINIAPVVVNNADLSVMPDNARLPGRGVLLWGSGNYRQSSPYLAYLSLDDGGAPGGMRYWGENKNTHQAGWLTTEAEAEPLFVQPCLGELSVTWNPFLRKWLMLYNCGSPRGINYRVSDQPWGPWSSPAVLFDPRVDGGFCHFMHQPGCDSKYDGVEDQRKDTWGGEYGPYVISRFTRGDATTTTIYWTMSTWNPYQVVLMKSTLRLSDARRIDRRE